MSWVVNEDQVAWMQSGVCSVVVASHDAQNRPSIALAFGCRLSSDRGRVTVFLLELQSHTVLADLRAGRAVSVLFTQSLTTRALQLKASSAREVPLEAGDTAMLDRFALALEQEWSPAAVPGFTLALMSREGDTLVAFELTPEQAFDQTPGPRAGAPLEAAS
jgi:hypothetical protein